MRTQPTTKAQKASVAKMAFDGLRLVTVGLCKYFCSSNSCGVFVFASVCSSLQDCLLGNSQYYNGSWIDFVFAVQNATC